MSPAVETTCERCGATIWVHVDIVWVPTSDSVAPYRIELVPQLDHSCDSFDEQLAEYDKRDAERAERFETIAERMRRTHD